MTPKGNINCYGIKLLKDKAELFDWLCAIDWRYYRRQSIKGKQLGIRGVKQAVLEGGFAD